jgi:hypothetical protein
MFDIAVCWDLSFGLLASLPLLVQCIEFMFIDFAVGA